LQYTTVKDQEWSANKTACIQLAPGAFQKKSFVLNENPAWNGGMITRFRFYSSADATMKIDEIQVDLKGTAWEFEIDGDVEGWLPWHQIDPFQASQGILEARATGNDPYMGSPGISLEAEKHTLLTVRMAVSAGRSAQLFFITATDPNFDEAKSTAFTVDGDGEFHTYTLDLSTVPGWKGIITQIRLDPADARSSIQVDFVRIQEP
jgi:hypothetical protein